MANIDNYIFIDESGDPGLAFVPDENGVKQPTGASLFYIISAICLDLQTLFLLEHRMMELKSAAGYKKEIKSNEISLGLYERLLDLLNELDIKTYYRLVDKKTHKGVFKVDGKPRLHNIFDEYNLAKTVWFAILKKTT